VQWRHTVATHFHLTPLPPTDTCQPVPTCSTDNAKPIPAMSRSSLENEARLLP
jgi:hypothetical protein